jgi:hypothetical protein
MEPVKKVSNKTGKKHEQSVEEKRSKKYPTKLEKSMKSVEER